MNNDTYREIAERILANAERVLAILESDMQYYTGAKEAMQLLLHQAGAVTLAPESESDGC